MKYRYAIAAFVCFLIAAGIIYSAISFSALNLNPSKWKPDQRDLFAFLGITLPGVISFMAYAISISDKSKEND